MNTIRRTLEIIEAVDQLGASRLTDIANHVDMNQSTVYHHLAALEEHQYVIKDESAQYHLGPAFVDHSGTSTTFPIISELKEQEEMSMGELENSLGVHRSIIKKSIQSLMDNGFVVRRGDKYKLSLRFLEIGGFLRNYRTIFRSARPKVDSLVEKTNNAAHLAVEEDGRGVYLYRATTNEDLNLESYIGSRSYLHTTAFGKAILAHLPESRVHEIIDRHGLQPQTPNTITDRETLFSELDEIREQRVAFDEEEQLEGLRCVSSTIINTNNEPLGAISVSGPATALTGHYFEQELPDLIQSAVNRVELSVNYGE